MDIFAEDSLYMPEMPDNPTRGDLIKLEQRYTYPHSLVQKATEASKDFYTDFGTRLPDAQDGVFPTPAINLVEQPRRFVQNIYSIFSHTKVGDVHLFPSLRSQIGNNIVKASGLTNDKVLNNKNPKLIFPIESDQPPEQLV